MYYDPLGRMVKTVNPDNSEQRVVFGIPEDRFTPGDYRPTPWERYHYSANDLAPLTNPGSGVPEASWYTPKSETIDPLGNVIQTTEHKAHYNADTDDYEDVVMKYQYDIKGQLLKAIDPYLRDISVNYYTTTDAIHTDGSFVAEGARTLMAYDTLQRPTKIWARDTSGEPVTLRQMMTYGDAAGLTDPQNQNLKGQLYTHNDEAGKLTYTNMIF